MSSSTFLASVSLLLKSSLRVKETSSSCNQWPKIQYEGQSTKYKTQNTKYGRQNKKSAHERNFLRWPKSNSETRLLADFCSEIYHFGPHILPWCPSHQSSFKIIITKVAKDSETRFLTKPPFPFQMFTNSSWPFWYDDSIISSFHSRFSAASSYRWCQSSPLTNCLRSTNHHICILHDQWPCTDIRIQEV